jgi:hypothetical protein
LLQGSRAWAGIEHCCEGNLRQGWLMVAVGLEALALESGLEHKLRKISRQRFLVIFYRVKSFIIF